MNKKSLYVLATIISFLFFISFDAQAQSPGGSNTQVQFNDNGVFGGDNGLTYNKTTDTLKLNGKLLPMTTGTVGLGSAALSFDDLFLASGTAIHFNGADVVQRHSADTLTFRGASSGYKFDADLFATGLTSFADSNLTINTKNRAAPKSIEIITGNATFGDNSGGQINIATGDGIGSRGGGELVIETGVGGATGNGGLLFLYGGAGGATSGAGGDITLTAGDAQGGNSNGGSLYFVSGVKTGSGTKGKLLFKDGGSRFYAILNTANITTSNKTFTFPDISGTLTLTSNNLSVFAPTTSAQLAGLISDETGSGPLVFATPGSAGNYLRSDGTNFVSTAVTYSQSTPADPSTTVSTTGVMMGIIGSITPVRSGKVLIIISGDIDNDTIGNGAQVRIRYGTGSAPLNGGVLTGTTAGALQKFVNPNLSRLLPGRSPFSANAIVTNLALNTAYWIDMELVAITGGTARVRDVSISVVEL